LNSYKKYKTTILRFCFQTIKAEDEGKKGSTAILNIAITDINDQNPEFQNLPYTFR
jgi:hypothetical protein